MRARETKAPAWRRSTEKWKFGMGKLNNNNNNISNNKNIYNSKVMMMARPQN